MIQDTLNDITKRLSSKNLDMHQRRVVNAANSVDKQDYVTRAELDAVEVTPVAQNNFVTTFNKYGTSDRNFNNVYYNPLPRPIVVLVSVTCTNGQQATAYVDDNSSPALLVGNIAVTGSVTLQEVMTFIVLPNRYYKLTKTGSPVLNTWCEWS